MGKYDGFLICSDIDGTLTYETGKVSSENLEAINYFMKEGGLFTISSGRSPGFIRDLHLPYNAPVIAVNGANIYDFKNEKSLLLSPMSEKTLDIADVLMHKFKGIRIRFIYESSWDKAWPDYDLKYLKEKEPVFKIAVHTETENDAITVREYIENNFPVSVVRGWETGVEITEKGVSKGSGLTFLKNYYKNKNLTTVAVGNFENDIPILKSADIAAVVKNASNDIKQYADIITPENTCHALKYLIENLDLFSKH